MNKFSKLPKKLKLSLLALTFFAGLFLANLLLIDSKPTRACGGECEEPEKVSICHCERPRLGQPFQCQTLSIAYPSALRHIKQHNNDSWGACKQPTPTEPEPTSTPVDPTPTDIPGGNGANGGGGPPGAPSCNVTTPGAPRLLSAAYVSHNQVKLIWQKVAGATHYTISYGPTSGNYPWGVPNTGDTNEFVVGDVTSTCFIVRAVNDCAPSTPSNEVCTGQVQGQVLGLSSTSGGSNYAYIIVGIATILFGTKLIRKDNFI